MRWGGWGGCRYLAHALLRLEHRRALLARLPKCGEYANFAEYATYGKYSKCGEYAKCAKCVEHANYGKSSMPRTVSVPNENQT